MSELLQRARQFWFNNKLGTFQAGDQQVSRQQIQMHGGPNPNFNSCLICQESEWLSRIKQSNLFQPHKCSTSGTCEAYCKRQGDPTWAHYWQNFMFAYGCNPNLDAPKALILQSKRGEQMMYGRHCDQATINFRRMLAQSCQWEVTTNPSNIDWSRYDFMFTTCTVDIAETAPKIPVMLYGHDCWKYHDKRQARITKYEPDIFLTPFLSSWKAKYSFPERTQIRMQCASASQFFTRPNLTGRKDYHLIVIGVMSNSIYGPRVALMNQVYPLVRQFKILFSNQAGSRRASHYDAIDRKNKPFLTAWSETLGSGNYVMFGPIDDDPQPVLIKYYECLGSGAIPIMPDAPDLATIGIKPMEHYIPVRLVQGNNGQLISFLNQYEDYKYIAENAIKWHSENADKMLFGWFEDYVQEITSGRYPRRKL